MKSDSMTTLEGRHIQVYVDAKIIGMLDKSLKKRAYVGYFAPESNAQNAKPVEAEETDRAEIQAILFAIDELGNGVDHKKIICDHQSVVSEATRPNVKKPSPLLSKLRNVLEAKKPVVELEALQSNLAHKIVTEYVNQESRK